MTLALNALKAAVVIKDKGGNKSKLTYVARGTDIAAFQTFITGTAVPALAAVTKCLPISMSVGAVYKEDTLVFPAVECNVENIATVNCRIDNEQDKTVPLRIPGPVEGLFVGTEGSDLNTIDINDAALLAYVALWQDASADAGDSVLLISDGEVLDFDNPVKNGKRIHRGSTKG